MKPCWNRSAWPPSCASAAPWESSGRRYRLHRDGEQGGSSGRMGLWQPPGFFRDRVRLAHPRLSDDQESWTSMAGPPHSGAGSLKTCYSDAAGVGCQTGGCSVSVNGPAPYGDNNYRPGRLTVSRIDGGIASPVRPGRLSQSKPCPLSADDHGKTWGLEVTVLPSALSNWERQGMNRREFMVGGAGSLSASALSRRERRRLSASGPAGQKRFSLQVRNLAERIEIALCSGVGRCQGTGRGIRVV